MKKFRNWPVKRAADGRQHKSQTVRKRVKNSAAEKQGRHGAQSRQELADTNSNLAVKMPVTETEIQKLEDKVIIPKPAHFDSAINLTLVKR
eukprot:5433399-Amphidinium_carterae.1